MFRFVISKDELFLIFLGTTTYELALSKLLFLNIFVPIFWIFFGKIILVKLLFSKEFFSSVFRSFPNNILFIELFLKDSRPMNLILFKLWLFFSPEPEKANSSIVIIFDKSMFSNLGVWKKDFSSIYVKFGDTITVDKSKHFSNVPKSILVTFVGIVNFCIFVCEIKSS